MDINLAQSATLEVDPSGWGYPYSSIQDAIYDASPGDTVLVHDGTYIESINFQGKAIIVRSMNGAARTIIDDNAVVFTSGEGLDSVLDGFSIRKGGISCDSSSPTIINCIISENSTGYEGGGISCTNNSSPNIVNCTIIGNTMEIGGGIYCYDSSPTIINCTISGNGSATSEGAGIYSDGNSSPIVTNSIVWGNYPYQIYFDSGSSITVTYSNIEGGFPGAGNINNDPLFIDPKLYVIPFSGGNYRLKIGSPCIDAANSDSPTPNYDADDNNRFDDPATPNTGTGMNGQYYDIGAYEFVGVECHDSDNDGFFTDSGCGGDVDCNDADALINPAAPDLCDGIDNDCDISTEDGSGELGLGETCDGPDSDYCLEGIYVCENSIFYCTDASGDDIEVCDGVDNDCNGTVDGITQGTTCGVGACAGNTGEETCTDGVWGGDTCDPFAGATSEICDGLDNDCNGNTDEGVTTTYYRDADEDTFGDLNVTMEECTIPSGYVTDNTDCDDTNPDINPAACDIKKNGIDEDCDGSDRQGGPPCR